VAPKGIAPCCDRKSQDLLGICGLLSLPLASEELRSPSVLIRVIDRCIETRLESPLIGDVDKANSTGSI